MKGGRNLFRRTTSSSALEWPCSFGSSAKCSPVSGVHMNPIKRYYGGNLEKNYAFGILKVLNGTSCYIFPPELCILFFVSHFYKRKQQFLSTCLKKY